MFYYKIYNFSLASEIELPELLPSDGEQLDLVISEKKFYNYPLSDEPYHFEILSNIYYFEVKDIVRFKINNGNTIEFERGINTDLKEVREYLYGLPVRAFLIQNGLTVFHASSVMFDNYAVLFAAPSGTGKSTLAAAFHNLGVPVLTEDITPLFINEFSVPHLIPGISHIKLMPEAAVKLNYSPQNVSSSGSLAGKFLFPVQDLLNGNDPVPVKKIYFIETGSEESITISSLKGLKKMEAIIKNMPYWSLLNGDLTGNDFFYKCSLLANKIDISQISRPSNKFLLSELIEKIKEDISEKPYYN